ncbi:hypothetical protein AAMO2058_000402600 [Amorphochlora amoebiformis]
MGHAQKNKIREKATLAAQLASFKVYASGPFHQERPGVCLRRSVVTPAGKHSWIRRRVSHGEMQNQAIRLKNAFTEPKDLIVLAVTYLVTLLIASELTSYLFYSSLVRAIVTSGSLLVLPMASERILFNPIRREIITSWVVGCWITTLIIYFDHYAFVEDARIIPLEIATILTAWIIWEAHYINLKAAGKELRDAVKNIGSAAEEMKKKASKKKISSKERVVYNRRDLILYALGLGSEDMNFIFEEDYEFEAFPTFPLALISKGPDGDVVKFPELTKQMDRIVMDPGAYGEVFLELKRPLNSSVGQKELRVSSKELGKYPNNKLDGTVAMVETKLKDSEDHLYATIRTGRFFEGKEDCGEEEDWAKIKKSIEIPMGAPDKEERERTHDNQALIYRLSGEYNPVHIKEDAAESAKLKRPTLPIKCVMGIAARHILNRFGGNRAKNFKSIFARFTDLHVYPGDTVTTKMWNMDYGKQKRVMFEVIANGRDRDVVMNGEMCLKEIIEDKKDPYGY